MSCSAVNIVGISYSAVDIIGTILCQRQDFMCELYSSKQVISTALYIVHNIYTTPYRSVISRTKRYTYMMPIILH